MAKKPDSRQRRANRNRAQREALRARTTGEGVKRPSRIAPSTAERLERGQTGGGRGDGGADEGRSRGRSGGGRDRTRAPRERPPRLGDRPVDVDTLEGGFLRKVSHVPGGLQVILTVGLAVVVSIITGVSKLFPDPGVEPGKDVPLTRTLFDYYGAPGAAALLAIPLAATLVALAFSLHPQRRRIWIGSSVVVFVAMLFNIVLMNFLVVGGFLIYAAWRSQRIENPPPPRPARGRRARAAEVDDTEVDDSAGELPDGDDRD